MKFFLSLLILTFISSGLNAQPVLIPEGKTTEVCGSVFEFIRIEFSAGRVFARVKFDGEEKILLPGDRVTLKNDCIYFINGISKDGKFSRGSLLLENILTTKSIFAELNELELIADTSITISSTVLSISDDNPKVSITSHLSEVISTKQEIDLVISDTLWLSGVPFSVNDIIVSNGSVTYLKISPIKNAISRVEEVHISDDEELSIDLTDKENFLIRKFYYSPNKRDQPDETSICLIRLLPDFDPEVPIAMPVWEVEREGKKYYIPYEVLKIFETEEQAITFAIKHGITDVDINGR